MKKILAVMLSFVLLLCALVGSAVAVPLKTEQGQMNTENLNALFADWQADEGYDGVYFSPVKDENDTAKYPLFVWVHGMNSGKYPRAQLEGYEFSNWASDEFQARFGDLGGSFLFAPRASFGVSDWNPDYTKELMYDITYFVKEYQNHIDTSRIYIGGYSTGGEIIWDMLVGYPQYFAAAVIAAPVEQPTDLINDATVSKICNIPIWVISSDNDYHLTAKTSVVQPIFEKMAGFSEHPENLRITSVSQARYANGMVKGDGEGGVAEDWQHFIWECVTYDMHMEDGVTPYEYCTTKDGKGNLITFEDPENGIIKWLIQYDNTQKRDTSNKGETTLERFIRFFTELFTFAVQLYGVIDAFLNTLLG